MIKKGKTIIIASLISVLLSVSYVAYADAALVPCGNEGIDDQCTICDIVQTGWNIMDFLKKLLVIVGILIITVAGVMYIVSAGNQGMISMAKAAIKNTLIGVSVMLVAFMMITFILNRVFKTNAGGVQTPLSGMGTSAWTFNCESVSGGGAGEWTGEQGNGGYGR